MHASKTAIILPIFTQWRLKEVVSCWRRRGNETKFDNIAFDLHWYHDFHSVMMVSTYIIADQAATIADMLGGLRHT